MQTAPQVIALIPAHDEARRIAAVVRGAAAQLPVLVVDDGSTDDTAAVAEAAGAVVLRQQPNQGKGAALRTGFARAIADGAAAVVSLDADGQHDPAELPRFLAAWHRGTVESPSGALKPPGGELAEPDADPPELVIGRRDFRRMPAVRRASNTAGTILLSAAIGRWIPDNQSGYRLVGRRLMTAMLDSREDGFAFEVEMIAVCLRQGWPIAWVPITTVYGDERSHIRPVRHLREFLAASARARRIARDRPR